MRFIVHNEYAKDMNFSEGVEEKILSLAEKITLEFEKEKLTYDEAVEVLRISEKFLGAAGVVSFGLRENGLRALLQ